MHKKIQQKKNKNQNICFGEARVLFGLNSKLILTPDKTTCLNLQELALLKKKVFLVVQEIYNFLIYRHGTYTMQVVVFSF